MKAISNEETRAFDQFPKPEDGRPDYATALDESRALCLRPGEGGCAEILSLLAKSEQPSVRCAVALNTAARRQTLARLAGDPDEIVRWAATRREGAEPDWDALPCVSPAPDAAMRGPLRIVLEEYVRRLPASAAAKGRIETAVAACNGRFSLAARERAAAHWQPGWPRSIIYLLCNDRSETVRFLVAVNRHTPQDVLNKLAGDDDEFVAWGAKRREGYEPDWAAAPKATRVRRPQPAGEPGED